MTFKSKPDDGSERWLEEIAIKRIRRQEIPNNYNYERIENAKYNNGVKMMPGETPESIQQARKYAEETYLKVPHAVGSLYASKLNQLRENADAKSLKRLGNEVTVKVDMDTLTSKIGSTILRHFGAAETQESVAQTLDPRIRAQAMMKMEQLKNGQSIVPNTLINTEGNSRSCRLLVGFPVYEQIQTNGFGTTKPLVKTKGNITPQLANVEFVIRESLDTLMIYPNEQSVDLGKIQNDANRNARLVAIQAPPMTGLPILFVPIEAVVTGTGHRGVLTDARNRPLLPGQQYLHQNNAAQIRPGQQMLNSNYQRQQIITPQSQQQYQTMPPKKTLLKG